MNQDRPSQDEQPSTFATSASTTSNETPAELFDSSPGSLNATAYDLGHGGAAARLGDTLPPADVRSPARGVLGRAHAIGVAIGLSGIAAAVVIWNTEPSDASAGAQSGPYVLVSSVVAPLEPASTATPSPATSGCMPSTAVGAPKDPGCSDKR